MFLNDVVRVIPEAQHRCVSRIMLIAQNAQRRCGQDQIPRSPGGQAQPAGGEDAQHVAVTEDHDGALHRPQAGERPVSTGAHRLDRLTARTAVAEEIPAWTRLANVGRASPLVLAVIPLLQVGIDLGLAAEAGSLARPPGPRARAHQHPGERDPLEPLAEAQGIVLAARGERDVCPTGMLTGACPGGLAMPRHIDRRKRCHHDFSCDALCSTSGDGQCRSHPEARATISSVHFEAGWLYCPLRISDLSSPGLARTPCRAFPAPPGANMRGRISRRAAPKRACAILIACQTP